MHRFPNKGDVILIDRRQEVIVLDVTQLRQGDTIIASVKSIDSDVSVGIHPHNFDVVFGSPDLQKLHPQLQLRQLELVRIINTRQLGKYQAAAHI